VDGERIGLVGRENGFRRSFRGWRRRRPEGERRRRRIFFGAAGFRGDLAVEPGEVFRHQGALPAEVAEAVGIHGERRISGRPALAIQQKKSAGKIRRGKREDD
jgi:hypothetical protein